MTATTEHILKDIEAGRYRACYLVYARKSTDEPENQKNSIAYQKGETLRFARRERLSVAPITVSSFCTDGVISERHSAFKETGEMEFGEDSSVRYRVERPKFHRLASFVAQGHFKGIIFLCWDRASRNKGDELILRRLMKAGVDVRFVLATYDDTSAGELHKDIDGMFAEHHSRVTREKVKGVIDASRAKGLCTHKAPVGYLNEGSMEWKPLDSERAPLLRQLFEKAAEGSWTLSDLRRWLIAQGFTMPPSRRRRSREQMLEDEERDGRQNMEKVAHLPGVSMVHAILTNPFYAGKVRGVDGWVASRSHEALVDEALFARVQAVLARRRTSLHYDKKVPLPFRGFLRCTCGRVYTPYRQKGGVYFGARCDRTCPNSRKSVNLAFVCETVGTLLYRLSFRPEELARIDAATKATVAEIEGRSAEKEAAERRAKKLRDDLSYLADNRATLLRTGAYTPEALAADEARFQTELERLEAHPAVSAQEVRESVAEIVNLSELVKDAQPCFEIAPRDIQETYARLVFSELTLSEETADFQCRSGFQALDRRLFSESALSCWLSELIDGRDDVRQAIRDLEAVCDMRAAGSVPHVLKSQKSLGRFV